MPYIDGETSRLYIEHEGAAIRDVQSFEYEKTRNLRERGAGIGYPTQTDIVAGIQGAGTFSMTVKKKTEDENGDLFEKLMAGYAITLKEPVASTSTTHTLNKNPVAILKIQLDTSGVELEEDTDYTVNYATKIITFDVALSENATITYVTDDWMTGENLMQNYAFEYDTVDNLWSGVVTGVVSRSSAESYVEGYSLHVAVTAQNDGAQYDPNITVVPGRTYRFRFAIKGTADDTFVVNAVDSGGATAMTAVGLAPGTIAGADWNIWEYTVTPDEATVLSLQILNSTATPHEFWVDHLHFVEDAVDVDLADGQRQPFPFNVVVQNPDGKQLKKFIGCVIGTTGGSLGDIESDMEENLSGMFVRLVGE